MSDCGCEPSHPLKPSIPPGLDQLPRHVNGFPQYRRAMLADVRCHDALRDWRAREGGDLGVMLVEMWSYVLDGLGFYDERIADESYIRTAKLRPSVRKLADLIGFRPQPALRGEAVLAVEVEEERIEPVVIDQNAGFRSQAFGDEPAQVFETEARFTVKAKTNSWTISELRGDTVSGRLQGSQLEIPEEGGGGYAAQQPNALQLTEVYLDPPTAGLTKDRIAIFRWPAITDNGEKDPMGSPIGDYEDDDGNALQPPHSFQPVPSDVDISFYYSTGFVSRVESVVGPDDGTYISVKSSAIGVIPNHILLSKVEIFSPTLSVGLTGLHPFELDLDGDDNVKEDEPPIYETGAIDPVESPVEDRTYMFLDSIYPNIRSGDLLVIERDRVLYPVLVERALVRSVHPKQYKKQVDMIEIPVSYIEVRPRLPSDFHETVNNDLFPDRRAKIKIHHQMINGGNLTNVAKLFVKEDDFTGGVPVETEQDPLPHIEDYPTEVILEDADGRAQLVCGHFHKPGDQLLFDMDCASGSAVLAQPMRTPIKIHGNLIHVTRGESVIEEVLGSGDPLEVNQTFKLQHNPITYRVNPDNSEQPLNYLTVRVDKVVWEERPSFFGAGPDDRIYIVRQDDEGDFSVIFGDGVRGKRPESGVDNITCNYRHGAGGAVPPAQTIDALALPIEGIKGVINPLPAFGGRDAQNRDEIRVAAGESVLSLDRTISLPDFEADARRYKDIVNVRAGWEWSHTIGRAVVQVWYISKMFEQPEEYVKGLERWLLDGAADNIEVVATRAEPRPLILKIGIDVQKGFPADEVRQAVFDKLADPKTGALSAANVTIGGLIFHSELLGEIVEVPGVQALSSYELQPNTNNGIPPGMVLDDYRVRMPRGYYPSFDVIIDAKFSEKVDEDEYDRAERIARRDIERLNEISGAYGAEGRAEMCGPLYEGPPGGNAPPPCIVDIDNPEGPPAGPLPYRCVRPE